MNNDANVEQGWNSLLRYVEDGQVIPIVGRDLLWIDVDGKPTYVPLMLAAQLAQCLGLPLPDDPGNDPVDRVVRAYYSQGDHEHQLPYAELNDLVRALDGREPPAALRKLAELPFSQFVSTTYDNLLERAVSAVRTDGGSTTIVVNSLGSPMDVPMARVGTRVIVHLLGRANPSPDYAITEADVIEFVHEFVRNNQPERLLKALKTQHVLVVGGFSAGLTRFLLRLARDGRLWANKGSRHFFAGREISQDTGVRSFLQHPLSTSSVFLTDDARSFVDELHARWLARGGRRPPVAPPMAPGRMAATPAEGGVFISYAKEDVEAAKCIAGLLTAAGVEVWFDRKDLLPGDQWDRVIRRSIAGCALFVALLSKHTQSAGYVQREWKWGELRREEIPQGDSFAFPVIVDGTELGRARLPEWFQAVQLTTALDGQVSAAFVQQVRYAYDLFHAAAGL